MYSVSENYLTAVRSKKRSDRVTGSITLADGSVIAINDSVLVKDTLKISKELCGGKYRVGTFCLSRLKFSFFLADALGLDLAGAYAELTYGILTRTGSYENVPLGRFYIDPVLSVRRKDIVSIIAFDAGVMFDREPSAELRAMNASPPELIAAACAECGVTTDIAAGSLSEFPNSTLTVSPAEKQIQSCRDIVMWCAALMCGYAVISRGGKLCIISAKYEVEPLDPTVISVDRNIHEDERESISVTDTRAYIKYLTAYVGSDIVNYTSPRVPLDEQAAPASYALEKNPLLAGVTAAQCDQANTDWLYYMSELKQRGVRARIYGDPAIDTGDTIMCRGGDVDQRGGIAGVITGIEWNYRGYTDITCLAAQCCGSLENGSGTQTAQLPQVRTQADKRMDSAAASGSGTGTGKFLDSGKTSVSHNDNEHNASSCLYDNISGYKNSSSGTSRMIGDVVYDGANTVTGEHNTLTGGTAMFIRGKGNTVTGAGYSDIGGNGNTAQAINACSINGNGNDVTNVGYSHIHGNDITVRNIGASGVFGNGHNISGNTLNNLLVGGKGAAVTGSSDLILVIGSNGNIFTVGTSGNVLAAGSYGTMGADYAEYFEWADGNPENEDRCGLLVSLDGDRLIPANGSDIVGAVSGQPSVIGGDCMFWNGKHVRDIYGRPVADSEGEPVISESFDPEREYIPRSRRSEWSPVGLVGRLTVRDDGSCGVGGYCRAENGIAVHSGEKTNVRVMKRLDGSHIEVLMR